MKLVDLIMSSVTVVSTLTPELKSAFADAAIVAFDMEGVDLSRAGRISLLQLASPEHCFLIDLLGKDRDDELVAWLRPLLESRAVLKIIHDSRMDSDALMHHLDIKLAHTHDTACWHEVITGRSSQSLNTVLVHNGIGGNVTRDASVYAVNPAFWATRPLTARMIQWASGDVLAMFALYKKQVDAAAACALFAAARVQKAEKLSAEFVVAARDRKIALVTVRQMGRFLGPRGINVHSLQRRSNTLSYTIGKHGSNTIRVYYTTEEGLNMVKVAADQS